MKPGYGDDAGEAELSKFLFLCYLYSDNVVLNANEGNVKLIEDVMTFSIEPILHLLHFHVWLGPGPGGIFLRDLPRRAVSFGLK